MYLKSLISITALIISSLSLATVEKEILILDYMEVVSEIKDTTISNGQAKVTVLIVNRNDMKPLVATKVFINTDLLIGETDSLGVIEGLIPAGLNRFCADTKEGNSLTRDFEFLEQYAYVVHVVMGQYKVETIQIEPDLYPVNEKPIIYLYPTKSIEVNVQVSPKTNFTFTYPNYPASGWSVIANPDGKLEFNNRTYNYLFWEAPMPNKSDINMSIGFLVHSDTVVSFLENTLTKVGLSNIEQADFITYWGPRLQQNKLNIIHFEFNEGYEKYISQMKISPKPDNLIRIFMAFTKYNGQKIMLRPQLIPAYQRTGFTVVEWGGTELL